ncbi:MAG: endopeptidase La, partial [Proteobacteria bacterium]
GREFLRISLGGVKDEAEIRGHRRTYVGAMPGKVIQGLKSAKSRNPVILLDEIDKLGSDFRGDPSAALLEVLDPEQNNTFRDHYLNLPFDLSNVMFLATANVLETIPAALRDRMEIISLSGYTEDEKLKIARRYLVAKQTKENGITDKQIEVTEEALKFTIENYTREAGLRNLERQVGTLCRKVARQVAEGEKEKIKVTPEMVVKFLGSPIYQREEGQEQDEVGISTGLAWTQAGGEILYIETSSSRGKGGVILTGQMGDVMKESATTAMSYIRGNADRYGLDDKACGEVDMHIHIPAGAIPKDGPSAGITMATAMISRLTGIPVRKDVAMTGEMTLTGKVLPIGGLKEKALAAMRLGITKIIIPYKNVKDLEDIAEEYRNKLEFFPVKHIDEVVQFALAKAPVAVKKDKKASGGGRGPRDRMSASESAA